jgi:hypothetical protein
MIRSLRERTRSVQCRVPGTGEHVLIRWVLSFVPKMARCRAVAVISHAASCLCPRTERIRPYESERKFILSEWLLGSEVTKTANAGGPARGTLTAPSSPTPPPRRSLRPPLDKAGAASEG